jgi:hypothetical protein
MFNFDLFNVQLYFFLWFILYDIYNKQKNEYDKWSLIWHRRFIAPYLRLFISNYRIFD